jgi:hypothetical protein
MLNKIIPQDRILPIINGNKLTILKLIINRFIKDSKIPLLESKLRGRILIIPHNNGLKRNSNDRNAIISEGNFPQETVEILYDC